MRINKICLRNYRQYRECEFTFRSPTYKNNDIYDVHIVIGSNTRGKSNLQNAINWCLYDKEPHLKIVGRAEPMVNLSVWDEIYFGEFVNVEVEIEVQDENKLIIYKRTAIFKKTKDQIKPVKTDCFLDVRMQGDDGNVRLYEKEAAIEKVELYFPQDIREVFFFDGEQLSNYFKESSNARIKNTVSVVSQVHYLSILEDRLKKIHQDKRQKLSRNNPNLSNLEAEISNHQNELNNAKSQLGIMNDQLEKSKESRQDISERLRTTPKVQDLDEELNKLNTSLDNLKKRKVEREISLNQIACDCLVLSILREDILHLQTQITTMRDNNQIPPRVDKELLEKMLNDTNCIICSSKLDKEKKEFIKSLLNTIQYSSELTKFVMEQDKHLSVNLYRYEQKTIEWNKALQEIKEIGDEMKEIETRRDVIDDKLKKIPNIEEARTMWEKREELDKLIEFSVKQIAKKENEIETREKLVIEKATYFDAEVKRANITMSIKEETQFCANLLSIVSEAKDDLIAETREETRLLTKQYFTDLNWVGKKYSDVLLNDNFELDVVHDGYRCIGSISTAETALLALSYILAIHDVSTLSAPLIIDTPISNISDANRTNFANVLSHVGKSKQLVLLMTPDEYSPNLREVFEDKHSSMKEILTEQSYSVLREVSHA